MVLIQTYSSQQSAVSSQQSAVSSQQSAVSCRNIFDYSKTRIKILLCCIFPISNGPSFLVV
ncbi:MAG TPA: hypothetical protein ENK91_07405 [Bacteroidetes bacterium]|nr:hypothetical protein [Bacteroidota bacterium]